MACIAGVSTKHGWETWVGPCLLSIGLAACGGSQDAATGASETKLAATASTVSATSATTYSVINLAPDGWDRDSAFARPAINAIGQAVFSGFTSSGTRAFLYNGTAVQDLGTLGGAESYAYALNGSGQVAGYATTGSGVQHAFLWTAASGMVDLGTLGGEESHAYVINGAGQVAGDATTAANETHAFSRTPTGGMTDLGTLGGYASRASAINSSGQVAGVSIIANNGYQHAFSWTPASGLFDLGTIGGAYNNLIAVGITDSGQIVGSTTTGVGPGIYEQHPFSWTQAGGMLDLGTFGGAWSNVYGVNNLGQVAGYAETASGDEHAFLWTATRGLVDLGTLGGQYSFALAINSAGQLAGNAYTAAGERHAFVWSQSDGMVDLNTRIPAAPAGIELYSALAIADNGSILASSNVGLVLLKQGATSNATPTVGPISANDPVAAGTQISVSASFSDADAADTHSATWSWGDGSDAEAGTVSENNGAGSVAGTHAYTAAGIYSVALKAIDNSGHASEVRHDVVVYDPSAGYVAGTGWIMSPPAAYKKDPALAGRATFAFISKYRRGTTNPTGKTEFQFHAANLSFRSEDYDWLVIAGARAQYKGSGTINHKGDFKFILTAIDGAVAGGGGKDRFRIKIWHHDGGTNTDVMDYDNLVDATTDGTAREGTVIRGGRIVIRK